MPAYLIAQIKVTDHDQWAAYRAAVGPCAEKHGGRYLARDATVAVLEGHHDGRRVVMFEFPSTEAIDRFWNSPDYAAVKRLREGAAEVEVWSVAGV